MGSPILIDFPAWIEDRQTIQDLRKRIDTQVMQIEAMQTETQRVSQLLKRDAAAIQKACDKLDRLSRELGRL